MSHFEHQTEKILMESISQTEEAIRVLEFEKEALISKGREIDYIVNLAILKNQLIMTMLKLTKI